MRKTNSTKTRHLANPVLDLAGFEWSLNTAVSPDEHLAV